MVSGQKFMGIIRETLPVKLIVGVLTSIPELLPETEEKLTALFGAIDARSEIFPFDWTGYYDAEMGSPLYRRFLGFADLIEAPAVAGAKIAANELEAAMAGKYLAVLRPVNLDPGYMEQSKIVLASTKNFFHRILVSDGIYAEVTLHYQDGRWKSFPWTFPDYGSEKYHPFFAALRENYRRQLNAAGFEIRIPKEPHRKRLKK
jgi:hypothetical protein